VTLEDFLEEGIKIINKFDESAYSYTDRIKLKYLIKILRELDNGIYIKRLIPKDATASVFQHLVKAIGPADLDAFRYCNLNSEDT
jgi:hypothetical protein